MVSISEGPDWLSSVAIWRIKPCTTGIYQFALVEVKLGAVEPSPTPAQSWIWGVGSVTDYGESSGDRNPHEASWQDVWRLVRPGRNYLDGGLSGFERRRKGSATERPVSQHHESGFWDSQHGRQLDAVIDRD